MKFRHVCVMTLILGFSLAGCFASISYQGGEVSGELGGVIDPGSSGTSDPAPRSGDGDIIGTGMASWYGGKFHGRETASGEIFDKWDMTAAHRTLPLGTRLVVERLSNGKAVEVKVNDRGPYVDGRLIDLSRGAAEQLNMVDDGVAKVRLYHVGGPGPSGNKQRTQIGGGSSSEEESSGQFTIQVGSFEDKSNALDLKARLTDEFEVVNISVAYDRWYRVRVGSFKTEAEARITEEGLQQLGLDTWIVREN